MDVRRSTAAKGDRRNPDLRTGIEPALQQAFEACMRGIDTLVPKMPA
jgi:hypothetical protein